MDSANTGPTANSVRTENSELTTKRSFGRHPTPLRSPGGLPPEAREGVGWRREWDSNPRYGFPHTRFPSVRLKPLGHLSGAHSLEGAPMILQGIAGKSGEISLSYCILLTISGTALTIGTICWLNRRQV